LRVVDEDAQQLALVVDLRAVAERREHDGQGDVDGRVVEIGCGDRAVEQHVLVGDQGQARGAGNLVEHRAQRQVGAAQGDSAAPRA